jgi:predicted transcriptional regulator
VIRLFRSRKPAPLGPLENTVMEVVWSRGESNVRDVADRLERPLAYTTVMTTLDRLYKKGLLDRKKSERAFIYSPRLSRIEWERQLAGHLVPRLLSSELLVSQLVEAAGELDEARLEELEHRIRQKRQEREQQKNS